MDRGIARLTASRGEGKRGNDTVNDTVKQENVTSSVSKPLLLFTQVVKYWAATLFRRGTPSRVNVI